MSHRQQIYDKEKEHFNLVRYQKFGKTFELVVDPDMAVEYNDSKDLNEILKAEKIFADAKKGLLASPEDINQVFGTNDFKSVAVKMIKEGEIQLTAEHRDKLREEKRKKIIHLIHRAAINPKTGSPHPVTRIENAILEAKIKIDEFKKAEDQVQDVLSKLKPIIPIKFDEKKFLLKMPLSYASKLHSVLTGYGKIENEQWIGNEFSCKLIIPAGLQEEVMDELNGKTHGTVQIEIEK